MLLNLRPHSRRQQAEKPTKGIGFHSFTQCIFVEQQCTEAPPRTVHLDAVSQISPLSHQKEENAPSFLDLNLQIKDDLFFNLTRTTGTLSAA